MKRVSLDELMRTVQKPPKRCCTLTSCTKIIDNKNQPTTQPKK